MNASACVGQTPLVCSIYDVARAVQEGPSFFDWLALGVIPLLSALASIGVLIFSVRTARAADTQAERSEEARVTAEQNRLENERRQRLNAALSDFLSELAVNLEEHRVYERSLLRGRLLGDPDPVLPSASPLIVRLGVAKMNVLTTELRFLVDLERAVTPSSDLDSPTFRHRLRLLPDLVAAWARESDRAKARAAEAVRQLANAKDRASVRDIQNWYRNNVEVATATDKAFPPNL